MARSPIKVASENDVTPPAEETLDFDDDNLRGEQIRCCLFLDELISMALEYFKTVLINHTTRNLCQMEYAIFWKVTSNNITVNEKNPGSSHFVVLF